MAGYIQDVISAAYHHIVAVGVAEGYVAGEVDAGDGVPVAGVAVGVAKYGAEKVGEGTLDYQQAAFVGFGDGLAFAVYDVHFRAGEGAAYAAGLDRHCGGGAQAGAAGFGLPPVVYDVAPLPATADVFVAPAQGLGVQRLAGAGQESQRPQVVLPGVFVAVAHQHPQGGGGGENYVDAVFFDGFVEYAGMGVVYGALAEYGRGPGYQRGVDDITVAYHPADVGGAPEYVIVFDIPESLEVVVGADHITAVDVLDAFGFAGGAAGVEDIEGIFGVHFLGGAVHRAAAH